MSIQTVIVENDQTASTTTLVDATGLAFTVNAGMTYQFRFPVVFRVGGGIGSSGIKLGLTCPAFTTFSANARIPVATSSVAGEFQGQITSSGDSVNGNNIPVINTSYLAVITGTIKPSASGTLQVQFARGGSGTATITLKANSGGTLQVVM